MRPSTPQLLVGAAGTIRNALGGMRGESYAMASMGTLGMLLILMSQEADRAAETLVSEQDAIRSLFADAAEHALPEPLRTRVSEAALGQRTSLRVDVLQAETDGLKTLLTEVHAWLETSPFDWAEALEARIWEILRLGAAARALYLPTL